MLFGLLALAQLIGVSLFLVVKRYQHFVAHFSGFLIPIFLSIGFCWYIYIYRYSQLHPDDHCGGQLAGAMGVMALGVAVQIIVGLTAQFELHSRGQSCASE